MPPVIPRLSVAEYSCDRWIRSLSARRLASGGPVGHHSRRCRPIYGCLWQLPESYLSGLRRPVVSCLLALACGGGDSITPPVAPPAEPPPTAPECVGSATVICPGESIAAKVAA